jgi:hypothetical protein
VGIIQHFIDRKYRADCINFMLKVAPSLGRKAEWFCIKNSGLITLAKKQGISPENLVAAMCLYCLKEHSQILSSNIPSPEKILSISYEFGLLYVNSWISNDMQMNYQLALESFDASLDSKYTMSSS